ncbi:cyclic-guanylate-specific phosphodiesterase [Edwardsiella ictaluri]|uniref:Cyclic-guanylate-specific phosphodiesterase n=1 Tax=Edwardsiella ictaluri TaxID=67780 RepID=A0ABY8GJN0_EDWIC|nr:cyclic-guanylate-specific phosphodiesterase [Edwardsiella ictaluri]ARD39727.1 cyclic-guanylate-specific phosphodiesterase [Edwardsiella ictaluri]ELV7527594.1 cyclic-guanylate-specific phosphodiesterase [Edwardsiella ictaluri]KMQ78625.1 c-di-GMP phosphodiesterase [Edwardsiella ictaluri]KOO56287.1 c-di-GMP phosphodiesterase [Edwardsiella ictaluri]QPW28170.1 cyclic-guanylate-specific phosphodiesterase [Edwardsiella ictaluri]
MNIGNIVSGGPGAVSLLHHDTLGSADWQSCGREYTFQPIYSTCGRLLAIELLTQVAHPDQPTQRLSPELYFANIPLSLRLQVLLEQLRLVHHWRAFFGQYGLFVSINVDGQVLHALQKKAEAVTLIGELPFLRFEILEHVHGSAPIHGLPDLHRLWLDDFGSGLANFSSLIDVRYEFVKLDRAVFALLCQTQQGTELFMALVAMMRQYSRGVIVEGVETAQAWQLVQRSDACAAQGYYLSRPLQFERLPLLPQRFAG